MKRLSIHLPHGGPADAARYLDIPALLLTLYCFFSILSVPAIPAAMVGLACALLIPGLIVSRWQHPPAYRRAWGFASFLFVLLMLIVYLAGAMPSYQALVYICFFLTLHCWFVKRQLRQYVEIWCLGSLLMLVGGMYGSGLFGLLILLGWAGASIQVFNLIAAMRVRNGGGSPYRFAGHSMKATWSIIPIALIFTLGLYYLLPRFGTQVGESEESRSLLTPVERSAVMAGYSEQVDLRSMSTIRQTRGVAFRVIDPPATTDPSQMRFRVSTLDDFDGWQWDRLDADAAARAMLPRVGGAFPLTKVTDKVGSTTATLSVSGWMSIRLIEYPGRGFPLPEATVAMAGIPESSKIQIERDGRLSVIDGFPAREYQVLITAQSRQPQTLPLLKGEVLPQHRHIAESVAPAVERAAMKMIPANLDDPLLVARTVNSYLKRNGTYTLDLSYLEDGPDALNVFLDRSMVGHCELFATSMALILREAGIPTRLVTGFSGADRANEGSSGDLVVRLRNAHAWVEAWIDGIGWVAFDPTPPMPLTTSPQITRSGMRAIIGMQSSAITSFFEDYDASAQKRIFGTVRKSAYMQVASVEDGAIVRAWQRIKLNIQEPAIIGLFLLLAMLNGVAWWLHLRAPWKVRIRRAQALVASPRCAAPCLFTEILTALSVEDFTRARKHSPRETIIHEAQKHGVTRDLALRLADLYNQWRYDPDGKVEEADIRGVLKELRQEVARAQAGR